MKKLSNLIDRAVAPVTTAGMFLYASAASAQGDTAAYASPVPEPSVMSLMAGGVATIVILARLKRKK